MNASALGFNIYTEDVNGNAEVEAADHVVVKAHFFGYCNIFNKKRGDFLNGKSPSEFVLTDIFIWRIFLRNDNF